MKPIVSIIIPVYNADKYLEQCIRSVIDQTYNNLEIILINDGSTDSSGEICDKYTEIDGRIKVIHKKNEGVSIARNTGIEIAKGSYIQFLDSDDFLCTNATEVLVDAIQDGLSELVVGSYTMYYDDEKIYKEGLKPFDKNINSIFVESYLESLAKHTTNVYFGSNWNKLYNSKIIKNYSLRFEENENYAEDFIFNLKYLKHTSVIKIIDTIVNNYRVDSLNSLSKSSRNTKRLWARSKDIYICFQDLFIYYNLFEKFRIDIEGFLLSQIIICIRNVFYEKELRPLIRYDFLCTIIKDEIVSQKLDHMIPRRFLEKLTICLLKQKACILLGLVYKVLDIRIRLISKNSIQAKQK